MSRNKAKGTKWESAIVDYLRTWAPHVERRALNGANDKGDITGIVGVVIEAKNQERHSLAEWVDEATAEGENAAADVAVVWIHRRGKASPGHGYVVMTGDQFVHLLRDAAYLPPLSD